MPLVKDVLEQEGQRNRRRSFAVWCLVSWTIVGLASFVIALLWRC